MALVVDAVGRVTAHCCKQYIPNSAPIAAENCLTGAPACKAAAHAARRRAGKGRAEARRHATSAALVWRSSPEELPLIPLHQAFARVNCEHSCTHLSPCVSEQIAMKHR